MIKFQYTRHQSFIANSIYDPFRLPTWSTWSPRKRPKDVCSRTFQQIECSNRFMNTISFYINDKIRKNSQNFIDDLPDSTYFWMVSKFRYIITSCIYRFFLLLLFSCRVCLYVAKCMPAEKLSNSMKYLLIEAEVNSIKRFECPFTFRPSTHIACDMPFMNLCTLPYTSHI